MLRALSLTVAAAALLGGQALAQTNTPAAPDPRPPAQPSTTATTTDTAPSNAQPEQGTTAVPAGSAAATQPATQPTPGSGMQTPSSQASTPATGQPFANTANSGTVFATLQGNPQFSMLVTALESTNLDDVLNDTSRQYTLFAPTNAAFEAVPEAQRTALMANPQALQRVLLHHVVGAQATAEQVRASRTANTPLPMADNVPQPVTGSGDSVMLGSANVVQADVRASNGIIHVVDAVIMAPGAAAAAATPAAPAASSTPAAPATTPAAGN